MPRIHRDCLPFPRPPAGGAGAPVTPRAERQVPGSTCGADYINPQAMAPLSFTPPCPAQGEECTTAMSTSLWVPNGFDEGRDRFTAFYEGLPVHEG